MKVALSKNLSQIWKGKVGLNRTKISQQIEDKLPLHHIYRLDVKYFREIDHQEKEN